MANNFVYSQPVKIYFGEGKFASLPEILTELGVQRCVIACGKHFAPQAEKLREEIEAVKAVFGGVEQNPQLSGIIETVKLCRETNADAVIGIGGGSSLDTAKFAAAISLGDGEAEEYYRGTRPFPDHGRHRQRGHPGLRRLPRHGEKDDQQPGLHAAGRDRRSGAVLHRASAHDDEHRP